MFSLKIVTSFSSELTMMQLLISGATVTSIQLFQRPTMKNLLCKRLNSVKSGKNLDFMKYRYVPM